MREKISLTLKDNLIRISILLALILILIQGVITFLTYDMLPPLMPLLNSQPWGVERLFSSAGVFLILPIFVVVFIFNNTLSVLFYKTNTLISRILTFNSLLFILLGFLAFVQILLMIL